MHKLYLSVLISGLAIMCLSLFLIEFKITPIILFFIPFVPGFIYGLVLITGNDQTSNKNFSFWMLSGLSYIACFFLADFFKETDKFYDSLKLLAASCAGSMILIISYLLIFKKAHLIYGILLALILVGILSALPSVFFFYVFRDLNHYQQNGFDFINFGLWIGILSIFPLWQTAFVWVINRPRYTGNKDNAMLIEAE